MVLVLRRKSIYRRAWPFAPRAASDGLCHAGHNSAYNDEAYPHGKPGPISLKRFQWRFPFRRKVARHDRAIEHGRENPVNVILPEELLPWR